MGRAGSPGRDPVLLALAATVFCGSLSMMAFVALVGPVARVSGLQPWQAGAAVSASGVMWMLGARPWGLASDRHGRRPVLLAGAGGFTVAYWLLCLVMAAVAWGWLGTLPAFAGLVACRALVGGTYAAIPAASGALIADRVPPAGRAAAMATLGTGSGAGLVAGPALAALLAPYGLVVPLAVTALLPPAAVLVLLAVLPRGAPQPRPQRRALALADRRIRLPLAVGFAAMFGVAIAQVSIGFFALDRLRLPPEAAAGAAGTALMLVGAGLVASQAAAARLRLPPERMIAAGAGVAALGFGSVALAGQAWMMELSYLVAALGMGWVFPSFAALAANSVDAGEQGGAAGAVGTAQGLGMVAGPVAGSLLYALEPRLPYVLVGALLLAVSLAVGRQVRQAPQPPMGGDPIAPPG